LLFAVGLPFAVVSATAAWLAFAGGLAVALVADAFAEVVAGGFAELVSGAVEEPVAGAVLLAVAAAGAAVDADAGCVSCESDLEAIGAPLAPAFAACAAGVEVADAERTLGCHSGPRVIAAAANSASALDAHQRMPRSPLANRAEFMVVLGESAPASRSDAHPSGAILRDDLDRDGPPAVERHSQSRLHAATGIHGRRRCRLNGQICATIRTANQDCVEGSPGHRLFNGALGRWI